MLRALGELGNPRLYATWRDESLSKTLKSACKAVSQATFEISVLHNMRTILETERSRKRPYAAVS
jgi:hypothetical protein